jgi:brefeldin A-resistance guanine nucleotide exchange factor 1
MTIDDYKRNLRGVNDGKDFNPEYLASIHESIKKREIILPEEHVGQPGFDYAWKSLMQRSREELA